ncbi:alpha/beta hydrolase family protein [Fibrella arboris]|uniref:alpha/beta hydrolase family protein n=1 Tax=Fibrella arboris TaxID=3242486 RepID=UPI003521AFA9
MKRLRTTTSWFMLLFVGLYLTNCKPTDPIETQPQTLVSSTQLTTLTKAQLVQRIAASGLVDAQTSGFLNILLQRDIQAYRLVYKTKNADNTDINASGVLIVPVPIGSETFPMVSEQHGTLFNEGDAPSYFTAASEAGTIGALFTSNGFILSCPDYVGYGESKNVPHPYLHRQTEALASLDMLRAAREFLKTSAAKWDNRVFLAGYSQGGHATMSLLKLMEEQFPNEFTITAASCGAGPYNVEGFMQDLVTKTTHGIAGYNNLYVWVLQTYNRVYGLNRPMSYYFRDPYAADVQANGTRSTINVSINTAFSDGFKNGITSGSDIAFLTGVRDNNVYDWKPKTPLQLYHGTADQQVFYRNSTDALAAMKARGATSVELITIPNKDHGPAIQDFLTGTFTFFNSKR